MRHRNQQRKASSVGDDNMANLTSLGRTRNRDDDDNDDAPVEPLCRFYVLHKGNCHFGSECTYSHDLPDGMKWEEAKMLVPCPFYARGDCRYGEYCQLRHDPNDLIAMPCANASELPARASDNSKELAITCDDEVEETEEALTCGICLEDLPNGGDDYRRKRRKFGLLSCCDHSFCIDCLMEWRQEGSQDASDRRCCPTCRKHSDYVVPSRLFPSSPNHKARIVQDYKDKLSVIPCRRFQQTQELGSCRFGSDCFYAHIDENGEDMKALDKSMEELARERQRFQEERRRREQQDFRTSLLGATESTMEDIDLLLSFLRLLDLYGYQGVREIYWSDDEDEADDIGDEIDGHHDRTFRFEEDHFDLDDTDFENVD